MSAADKLTFVPSKSVTFMPNSSKQMAEMTVTNTSDKNIMFKMKSTRPGMFKMRPVYGVVAPNDKTVVRLIFKGLKPGQEAPRRERFTVVCALAPSSCVDVEKIWKSHKYQEKLSESDVAKKKFRILFFGINDQEEEEEEEKEKKEAEEKKKKISEGDPEDKANEKATGQVQKEKIVENVIIKKEVVQAPPKQLVMVMYRDQKDDSQSGDSEDDADATVVAQPTKTALPLPPQPPQSQQPLRKGGPPAANHPTQPPQPVKQSGPPASTDPSQLPQTCRLAVLGGPPKAGCPAQAPAHPAAKPTAGQQKQLTAMDENLLNAKTCRINPNIAQRPAAPVKPS